MERFEFNNPGLMPTYSCPKKRPNSPPAKNSWAPPLEVRGLKAGLLNKEEGLAAWDALAMLDRLAESVEPTM